VAQPTVTLAVLNFDGRHLLEVILPSLAAQTQQPFDVVVVDNGSHDDSLAYLRDHWPMAEVVAIPDNVGVAAALNRALAAARGEFVALLNNDLELDPAWLAELVGALDRDPRLAAVACKLLDYRRRELLDGAGDLLRRDGSAHRRGHGELDRGQYDREEEVFAPTAGAGLYRAAALADVGPFDESFFAYFEDVDWGLRAQLAGYRTWYVPTAVAYHMGSATTKGDQDPFYYGLHRRNVLALVVKDLPFTLIVRYGHRIARTQLGGLFDSARAGMLGVHLRALAQALRLLPRWLRCRRRIQRSRRVGAARLAEVMSDR
jgi:GT2 family glycosyltransferase